MAARRKRPAKTPRAPAIAAVLDVYASKGMGGVVPKTYATRTAFFHAAIQHIADHAAACTEVFDEHDSVRDRLFALLMHRIDALQEHRPAYVRLLSEVHRQPGDVRHLGVPVYADLQRILRTAGAESTPVHILALFLANLAILAVWRNDTTTDLSKTMKACDKALGLLARAAGFIYSGRT